MKKVSIIIVTYNSEKDIYDCINSIIENSDIPLAEIELVKKITGDTPILLLDDVLSELDCKRQNQLLGSIGEIQTIITCTGMEEFVNNRFEIDRIFKVCEGKAECMNDQKES